MKYTITKLKNGCWEYENKKGIKTQHSLRSDAEKMAMAQEHFHGTEDKPMTTHNTEIEEWNTFVEHVREYGAFPDGLADYCKDHLHHQLQKARQDWLREEIVRLGKIKEETATTNKPFELAEYVGKMMFIDELIQRYQKELNQDNKLTLNEKV